MPGVGVHMAHHMVEPLLSPIPLTGGTSLRAVGQLRKEFEDGSKCYFRSIVPAQLTGCLCSRGESADHADGRR
jgi:hypothetical protein